MDEKEREYIEHLREGLYQTYKKAFTEVFHGAMTKLHPTTETAVVACKISRPELILKACREVLETYEKGLKEDVE